MENNDQILKEYEVYFKENLEALQEELAKSKEYSKIVDTELNKYTSTLPGTSSKVPRLIIDMMENAVALQAQRQSILKDIFSIKKTILDYSIKNTKDDEGTESIFKKVDELVKATKENLKQTEQLKDSALTISDSDMDAEIDKMLGE